MRAATECPLNLAPASREIPARAGIKARRGIAGLDFNNMCEVRSPRIEIALDANSVRLTTTACRARLSTLTTEHSNQHLSVTRAPAVRRNTSAMTCGKRGTKGNPVQIRCGRATVIGETLSRGYPFEAGCLRKPLSAQCGWEGGEPSLSAMSQEACLRCFLTALRGTSEADLPVNRAWLAKATGCP